MPDILHMVGVKSSPEDVYQALTTIKGLSGWWTTTTQGDSQLGGVIQFRFGTGGFDMKVLELQPAERLLWQVVAGPEDWVGTTISFDLTQNGDDTDIAFKHAGWQAPTRFMHQCSTKWGVFLMSLKALLEIGQGAPWPHDTRIGGWESRHTH